jgi:hypothetical protein
MEDETFTSEETQQSYVKWTQNSRGLNFEFKEIQGKPLTREFLANNEETLNKLMSILSQKIIDMKVAKANKENLE